jgi:hypothetical protein
MWTVKPTAPSAASQHYLPSWLPYDHLSALLGVSLHLACCDVPHQQLIFVWIASPAMIYLWGLQLWATALTTAVHSIMSCALGVYGNPPSWLFCCPAGIQKPAGDGAEEEEQQEDQAQDSASGGGSVSGSGQEGDEADGDITADDPDASNARTQRLLSGACHSAAAREVVLQDTAQMSSAPAPVVVQLQHVRWPLGNEATQRVVPCFEYPLPMHAAVALDAVCAALHIHQQTLVVPGVLLLLLLLLLS